jgi:hypothetical protein
MPFDQLAALPSELFPFYAEQVALLEVAPWGGTPMTGSGPMR